MSPTVLVDAGRPKAALRLSDPLSPVLQWAAQDLGDHLRQISGAAVTVGEAGKGGTTIHLGRSPAVDKLLPGFDWAALKDDGVVVRALDQALILAGNSPQASMYAAYEFLDQVLGCRWLPRGVSHVPRRDSIDASGVNIVHTPPFRYREPYFSCIADADWAVRNRVNGNFFPLDASRGGRMAYAGFVHTFYPLVPPAKYFPLHPEFFSEIDGKRVGVHAQLCLTNPSLLDLMVQQVRNLLLETPEAAIVSISQNDWGGYCTCRDCRRIDEAEGTPAGTLVRFVNQVAERLEGEFPKVLFDTLAYAYGVAPPKNVRPRHNVIIRLCHLNSPCDSHPIAACEHNRIYHEQIRAWTAISPEVFVWDYFNNFAHYFLPYPNLDAIVADLPMYAAAGVTGMFCQGDATPPKGPGDMAELRAWLLGRLLWRPKSDGKALIEEFLRLYYGPAAESIQAYLDLLHEPVRKGGHISPYMAPDPTVPFLSPETMKKAARLLDQAVRKAGSDEALRERVEAARLPVEYMGWRNALTFTLGKGRYLPASRLLTQRAKRFLGQAMAMGCEGLSESSGMPIREHLQMLDGAATVEVEGQGLRAVVCPAFGGRVLAFYDPAEEFNWMHWATPEEPGFPIAGGYEEYTQSHWRSAGWRNSFVAQWKGERLWLSTRIDEAAAPLVIDRWLWIETTEDGPGLVIDTTLRNAGYGPAAVLLRLHSEFDPGPAAGAGLDLHLGSGKVRPWTAMADGKQAIPSETLEGESTPRGRWDILRGKRRLAVRFSDDRTTRRLATFIRRLNTLALDLYGPEATLLPGQKVTYRQVWTPGKRG